MSKQAWVFPGQGSQNLGMLSELASEYAIIQETFAQASKVLGYDLWNVVQNDEQKLRLCPLLVNCDRRIRSIFPDAFCRYGWIA